MFGARLGGDGSGGSEKSHVHQAAFAVMQGR